MFLSWQVKGTDTNNERYFFTGLQELQEVNHVVCKVPDSKLYKVVAKIAFPTRKGEKIFMNGYQTWTYCPEYTRRSRIRGIKGLPQRLVDQFGLDRYADYHFVKYRNQPGVTHGFSFCYFRYKDKFRFFGSLNEEPGYTQFKYDANDQILTLRRDCRDVRFEGDYPIFDLFYMEGSEKEVFDAWFKLLNLPPVKKDPLCGYSSWYNRYQNISSKTIGEDLEGCKRVLEEGDLFQIDDGWEPFVGDWLEPDTKKFPEGMKKEADRIHEAGYKAGLWLAPFVAETNSSLYKEHPDWFLIVDGEPWKDGCNWSGFYSLDIDHPEVIKYLEEVFHRVFDEWGFDLVKLDFLYGAAPFGNEKETRAARMIRAMKFLRKLCKGKEILGCGVPVMPAFGYVDYCRISCDVSLDWNDVPHMRIIHRERVSTKQAIGNVFTRFPLHNRAYSSDPDVFFLRDENCRLTSRQKELLAKADALLGGVWLMSDNPSKYTKTKIKQYKDYRKLTKATNVKLDRMQKIITYELDGEVHALDVSELMQ